MLAKFPKNAGKYSENARKIPENSGKNWGNVGKNPENSGKYSENVGKIPEKFCQKIPKMWGKFLKILEKIGEMWECVTVTLVTLVTLVTPMKCVTTSVNSQIQKFGKFPTNTKNFPRLQKCSHDMTYISLDAPFGVDSRSEHPIWIAFLIRL